MIQQAYREVLEDLKEKQRQTAAVIASLEQLLGADSTSGAYEFVTAAAPRARRGGRRSTKRRTARRPPAAGRPRRLKRVAQGEQLSAQAQAVQARDQAILTALHGRPMLPEALLAVLPAEHGQTEAQRASACRNALTRLQAKKLIQRGDHGWELRG